jgi:hypothetical protein
MGRYDPLTDALREGAQRDQEAVELSFARIEEIIGRPLPPSSERRQWWANNSHGQALAWRAAGYHVEQVYLDRRRVRFARGERGGTLTDRGRVAVASHTPQPRRPAERHAVGEPVDVRVQLQWTDAGPVILDGGGKLTFAVLEEVPGLYRMTLTGGVTGSRPRVYVGESDNLKRRLTGNYRNPGPGQQTSLRVNALLREHLAVGGDVAVAIATSAVILLNGAESELDLKRKAGRLLAENAALVLAQVTDDSDIANLG